jgi:hypothetical protein
MLTGWIVFWLACLLLAGPTEIRAAQCGKLGHRIDLLPVPAGNILRIIDLMPRP